jgi:ERCC4-type nuclease
MASAISTWKTTMQVKAGILIERTWNDEETADLIAGIYKWWNLGKGWDQHRAHLAVNKSMTDPTGQSLVDNDIFRVLTRRGEFAAVLPGVGAIGCRKAQKNFKSIFEMANAPISRWREIVGVVDAVKIHRAIREEEG